MTNLLAGLLSALVVTNQPAVTNNRAIEQNAVSSEAVDTNDPVEKEFQKLLEDDDAAQAEAEKWIQDNHEFASKGGGMSNEDLNRKIRARLAPVRKSYEDFLERHPNHARARLAFAGFLQDIRDEEAAVVQMEKSLELDPRNPAVWNNLANHYGHDGPVKKAFDYYAKAIELNPKEPVYYHNFGTTVYLFRTDAKEHFGITEAEVFDKALALYAKAVKLAPDDFPLATDVAQTYYGIKPLRTNEALSAWTNALQIAHDDVERQGVYLHLARVKIMAGRLDEARLHLEGVTDARYDVLKTRLTRALARKQDEAKATNPAPVPPRRNITPP